MTVQNSKGFWLTSIFAVLTLAVLGVYAAGRNSLRESGESDKRPAQEPGSVVLPVSWNSIGKKLVAAGVLDAAKLEELYAQRGGLTGTEKEIITGDYDGPIILSPANSGLWLNMFWALGLGNENEILSAGMADSKYGGSGVFASTGGWTLSKDSPMNHYGAHDFIVLSPAQQALVDEVSRNVYRPCCDNPAHFPDCNHGMAMLGLLELAAAQGADEGALYSVALAANMAWFPQQYGNVRQYFEQQGQIWSKIDPKIILSSDYSGYSGYGRVVSALAPSSRENSSSCGA